MGWQGLVGATTSSRRLIPLKEYSYHLSFEGDPYAETTAPTHISFRYLRPRAGDWLCDATGNDAYAGRRDAGHRQGAGAVQRREALG